MTDQEINTAIAEACGITMIPCTCTHWPWKDAKTGRHTLAYTTDLNAMHDAEKVLMGWSRRKILRPKRSF